MTKEWYEKHKEEKRIKSLEYYNAHKEAVQKKNRERYYVRVRHMKGNCNWKGIH